MLRDKIERKKLQKKLKKLKEWGQKLNKKTDEIKCWGINWKKKTN